MSLFDFIHYLTRLPLRRRRILLIVVDIFLLLLSVLLSFWFRSANLSAPIYITAGSWLLVAVPLVGVPLYAFTGQYKGLTRYVGSAAVYQLALRNCGLLLSLVGLGFLFRLSMPPRSSWILLWLLLTGFTTTARFVLRDLLLSLRSNQYKCSCVSLFMVLERPGTACCSFAFCR